MSKLRELLDSAKENTYNNRDFGTIFERLIKKYLEVEPTYKGHFSEIWLWEDFPEKTGKDVGIDLVAKNIDGTYCAIQCKCYEDKLSKKDIDSFVAETGKDLYSNGIIVTTTNQWTTEVDNALRNRNKSISIIGLDNLENSAINWESINASTLEDLSINLSDDNLIAKKSIRPHQKEALENTIEGFKRGDRGKLIMACGTGKTYTSLKIMEEQVKEGGMVLFLVPSLALLNQALEEYSRESTKKISCFAVCSDSKIGKNEDNTKRAKAKYTSEEDDDISTYFLEIPATTNYESLNRAINKVKDDRIIVIFSTYQSIEVIEEAQKHGLDSFDLIICDEAHRTTGLTKKEEIVKPPKKEKSTKEEVQSYFTKVHRDIKAEKRLYMTATPRVYINKTKAKAEENSYDVISMDDEAVYGKEFYRLDFSKALEKELLSDYKVLVLAINEAHIYNFAFTENLEVEDESKDLKKASKSEKVTIDDRAKIVGCWNALAKVTEENKGNEDNNHNENNKKNPTFADKKPMQRVLAFTNNINSSKLFSSQFQTTIEEYKKYNSIVDLNCESNHVDGTMNALQKKEKLSWLKANLKDNECRILSNARCLSEGVDVPALDAVIFVHPRKSQVDIVQAVGRVMRKYDGKKEGYVILPIVVKRNEDPVEALNNNKSYEVVWQVLQALRSHDEKLDIEINKLQFNNPSSKIEVIGIGYGSQSASEENEKYEANPKDDTKPLQLGMNFPIEDLKKAFFTKTVDKCGDREYLIKWSKDVARIVEHINSEINKIIQATAKNQLTEKNEALQVDIFHSIPSDNKSSNQNSYATQNSLNSSATRSIVAEVNYQELSYQDQTTQEESIKKQALQGYSLQQQELFISAFITLQKSLQANINTSINEQETVSMLSQHIVIKPVFDELFKGYDFVKYNPVANAMEKVANLLEEHPSIKSQREELQGFYDSVSKKVAGIKTLQDRQTIIKELYGSFFKEALPKEAAKLGITYTPIEVIDFILASTEHILNQEFNTSLNNHNVNIIDPFTGAGTFITRLLQSDFIKKDQLEYKYKNEIQANEILLLAYYIASLNIESVYLDEMQKLQATTEQKQPYTPFSGIVLTDTFNVNETKNTLLNSMLEENNARIKKQQETPFTVIMGNPPYSARQESENDNNQNLKYPNLDKTIRDSYANESIATNKNGIYDSYIRALRYASNLILPKETSQENRGGGGGNLLCH